MENNLGDKTSSAEAATSEGYFYSHWSELRKRIGYGLIFWSVCFLLAYIFFSPLYGLIVKPLLSCLPPDAKIACTKFLTPFTVPLTLGFYLSSFASFPYFAYQIWQFIAPGLYIKEKKMLFKLIGFSLLLFYSGLIFAYEIFFPLIFKIFVSAMPQDLVIMLDINSYLSFFLNTVLVFGLAFQTPLLINILVAKKILNLAKIRQKRPYAILGILIISMLLTPPDVLSMLILALPLYLLFELGILVTGLRN